LGSHLVAAHLNLMEVKMSTEYKPRLSVDITQTQRNELDRILGQYGLQRAVFSVVIDDLIEAVNRHGHAVVAGLISRSLKLGDISKEVDDNEPR